MCVRVEHARRYLDNCRTNENIHHYLRSECNSDRHAGLYYSYQIIGKQIKIAYSYFGYSQSWDETARASKLYSKECSRRRHLIDRDWRLVDNWWCSDSTSHFEFQPLLPHFTCITIGHLDWNERIDVFTLPRGSRYGREFALGLNERPRLTGGVIVVAVRPRTLWTRLQIAGGWPERFYSHWRPAARTGHAN